MMVGYIQKYFGKKVYWDNSMKEIILKRVSHTKLSTFGVMIYNDLPFVVTLEEAWRDNQRSISCIPEGRYLCRPYSSAKYKNVWELQDVPNRSKILIHAGNTHLNTEGCILVGSQFQPVGGVEGVQQSKEALDELRVLVGLQNSFWLIIEGIK